jgi:hypothetical protein
MDSGSSMFSCADRTGRRLKDWKMNPTLSRRTSVRRLSSSLDSSVPSRTTEPDVGRSRPASRCMSVDLPSRTAHDRGELAGGEADGDAREGVDRGFALAVAAGEVGGGDEHGSHDARRCVAKPGGLPLVRP